MTVKNQWIELPEPLPIGPVFDDGMESLDSFYQRDLLKGGTIIRLQDGNEELIGDINEMLGTCDCCSRIRDEDLVVAYYVIDAEWG